jgi:hypothetical protein
MDPSKEEKIPTGTTTEGEEEENSDNRTSPLYIIHNTLSFLLFILPPTRAEEHEFDNAVQVSKTKKLVLIQMPNYIIIV